jgi:hypothetical protein
MSNIKFYTNRQIALQNAMELYKKGSITKKEITKYAQEFYIWLQDAPQKDSDNKEWLKINEIK